MPRAHSAASTRPHTSSPGPVSQLASADYADRRSPEEPMLPILDSKVFGTLRATLPASSLLEIYTAFLSDTRHRLEALGGAPATSKTAHAIRGTAGMLGATAIAELAHRLDEPGGVSSVLEACEHLQIHLRAEGLAL